MDSGSSNDDDEPKVCTVFSSAMYDSKTVFDTIAFSKKDSPVAPPLTQTSSPSLLSSVPKFQEQPPTTGMFKTSSMISVLADDLQQGGDSNLNSSSGLLTSDDSIIKPEMQEGEGAESNQSNLVSISTEGNAIRDCAIDVVVSNPEQIQQTQLHSNDALVRSVEPEDGHDDLVLPTAEGLFADAPEVAFPVNITEPNVPAEISVYHKPEARTTIPQSQIISGLPFVQLIHNASVMPNYDSYEPSYDAWIPSEEARLTLSAISAQSSGTYFPDKSNMTMPGIMHEDEFVDKVAVNMARVFGDNEANKRKILSADSVTQDDNGIRELIKLGCYRSALNLTKRMLTLCGQGPGKTGHYSKHSPHSLQVWFTRISLLIRIREFAIAESEVSQFADFEKADMYYEYYPDSSSPSCKRHGSMVPFYFRLIAAEISQYMRKFNDTIEKLTRLLHTVIQISKNLESGFNEDGSSLTRPGDILRSNGSIEKSIIIWKSRKIRVLYSLANSALFSKQYYNAFTFLTTLCEVDKEHETQLKSAIGRLFLQHGDLTSAQKYFLEASELRNLESDADHVDTLVDSALIMITQNSYPEALALLTQASNIQPDNFMILNNMAVCLLYLGKVKESLALMETTVKQNIPQSLQENVLLNLSSIYELENSDGSKKNSVLRLISEYKGDGINLASLKMPNLI